MDPATIALLTQGGKLLANGVGSYFGNKAKEEASAKAQEDYANAIQNAVNFQSGVYNTAKDQYTPYVAAGTDVGLPGYIKATQDYTQPTLNYNQADFNLTNWKDPGYDFRLDQATKAINAATASKGMTLGSGALKSLQTRGQDMASQEYQNSYDRFLKDSALRYGQASDQYARDAVFRNSNIANYGNLANMGAGAIGSLAGAGQNASNNLSQLYSGLGKSASENDLTQGNLQAQQYKNWSDLGGSLFKDLGDYFGSDKPNVSSTADSTKYVNKFVKEDL